MGLDTASSEVNERKLHDVPMNSTTNADAAHQKGMQNIYLLFEERYLTKIGKSKCEYMVLWLYRTRWFDTSITAHHLQTTNNNLRQGFARFWKERRQRLATTHDGGL